MIRKSVRRLGQAVGMLVVAVVVAIAVSPLPNHVAGRVVAPVPTIPTSTSLDPGAFARGACVALAPTHGDRHATVFLDAGHGGIDPGALGTTESGQAINEAQETLPIELDATSLLRAQGYRVVVSRTSSSTVVVLGPAEESQGLLTLQGAHDDVAARDVCANLAGAAVLIGIYLDAGSSPENAGCLTAYDPDRQFLTKRTLGRRRPNRCAGAIELQGLGYSERRGSV